SRELGVGGAEPGRRDGALDEAGEAVVVGAGGGALGDAPGVDHDAEADVGLVAGHVLVDVAVGEAGEGAAPLAAGDEGLGSVADRGEHPVADVEADGGSLVGGGVPGHQWTPTCTLVNRAGTDGWPVWPTCMGWPLPQLAVPQNTHSSGPPTMSMDAQNCGPIPL